ncbi:MAG: carbohydrate-binding domain-containing protein, partial [Clostridia bacterium]|nr:carbohydrate-binding domain-containing protein [Clostridia bacterium]
SKSDLTLNGSGKLSVCSPSGHGIVCKDDLCITDGIYSIESALHGIDANNSIRVKAGELAINSGKDGFHSEHNEDGTKGFVYVSGGSFDITAEGDGISASSFVQIEKGSFKLLCGNGADNGSSNNQMGGYYGTTEDTESKKGIKSVNAMLIDGGEFDINSADDAVHSNKSITVNDGNFTVATGDDGFHADESLTVNDGTINIGRCYEGLEALDLIVVGGKISLEASDDGLNAAGGMDSSGMGGNFGGDFGGGRPGGRPGERPMDDAAMSVEMMAGGMMSAGNGSIVIKGGELYIKASGDGIDANGTLEITGGAVTICGPTRGDTATLDFDKTGTISGGTFIGTGASGGMTQTFSTSHQGIISVSVGNQSAGTTIIIKDSDGKELLNYAPVLDFGLIIFSHENLVKGDSYDITVGDASTTCTVK